MDIEFHYYMTYLIAKKAGFDNEDAEIIAYSSQYVDDNDMIFEINKDRAEYYKNYISQTMNILKPKDSLFRIYPLFHFIPGDPLAEPAARKDGKLHRLTTTPNSESANKIMGAAIESDNLYRIGIATHTYVDTWAHQNFVGYYEEFNAMSGMLEKAAPNIGHADAGHNPDWPALRWKDSRLLGDNAKINNTVRFMDAARHLFKKLRKYVDPTCSETSITADCNTLIANLEGSIGERDQDNKNKKVRLARYIALGTHADYGSRQVPDYDEETWMDDAVNEDVKGLKDKSDFALSRWDPFVDIYTWKDPHNYHETHWHKFQEAVKEHQNTAWAILDDATFSQLDLESL